MQKARASDILRLLFLVGFTFVFNFGLQSATRTVPKYANESDQAVNDDVSIPNESRAREVFSAIAL